MSNRTSVLLMTAEAGLAASVGKALEANGHVLVTNAVRDPRELLATLSGEPAPLALVDLDPNPRQVLAELERIIERFPTTRFVALSSTIGSDLLLEAMQAGVRRVLSKETIPTELAGVLNRLTPGEATGGPAGEVITILSASGGCGATTIAANLAAELGHAPGAPGPALLIDLDCCYGALSTYFGVSPRYAIDHVLQYERPADADLIRSTATVHSPQIHLLASPASTRHSRPFLPDFARLGEVISVAARAYPYTVIDAPRLPVEAVATLVSMSTHVLLVFQLTVKDLRIAKAMLDAIDELGVPRHHLLGIANRYHKSRVISLEDAAKVLNNLPIRPLRNDYPAAVEGINYGKTLAQAAPRSAFRKDLHELIASLMPSKTAR